MDQLRERTAWALQKLTDAKSDREATWYALTALFETLHAIRDEVELIKDDVAALRLRAERTDYRSEADNP